MERQAIPRRRAVAWFPLCKVSPDGFRLEPLTDSQAEVTFRCTTGDYILLIYGRLPLEQAMATGRLAMAGDHARALLFPTLFQGV